MKAIFGQLLAPLALAALAWFYLDLTAWLSVAAPVILSLSVVGAAVLFRLGRGLPEFHVRDLDVEDIDSLTDAYSVVAQRLSGILAWIGVAIGLLIVAHFVKNGPEWLCSSLTSLGVYFVSFVVCRTVVLVKGDLDLVRLQGKLLVKEIEANRTREHMRVLEAAREASPFDSPEGYGGLASR